MATAVNGFKKCGIWPYDATVFSNIDFAPSLTTDIPQTEILSITEALPKTTTLDNRATAPNRPFALTDNLVVSEIITVATSLSVVGSSEKESISEPLICRTPAVMTQSEIEAEPQPGCSTWMSNIEIDQRPITPSPSVFSVVSPQQVMPYPVTPKITRVTRKRGKTAIITSSPYKNELEETIKKKKLAEDNKENKRKVKEQKKKKKNNLVKKKNKKTKNNHNSPPESDNDENNIPCFYCHGKYLDSNEGWAACSHCGKWAHCSCARIDDEDDEAIFICEFCKQKWNMFPIPYLAP